MRHHVTPPISADPDLNRDDFEPNIDSVGTPPKRPHTEDWQRYTLTLPRAPAPQRLRPHAFLAVRVGRTALRRMDLR